jgi:hypothetical protein
MLYLLGSGALAAAFAPVTADAASKRKKTTTRVATPSTLKAAVPTTTVLATAVVGSGAAVDPWTIFPKSVRATRRATELIVESTGIPEHQMMVGITNWQQQVPLPQPFTGTNAWHIPLKGVLADSPISAKTALFRGAIALAINGVPIFNALNNRGEDSFLIGELDQWGGHCGRADDYHYHAAPLHLGKVGGAATPIAIALDGFPVYGLTEPDGSPVRALDHYNGHTDATDTYHYHSTLTYPYINGGMRGKVQVVGDQVDPQPSLKPIRPAGQPLRGASITSFTVTGTNAYRVEYAVSGATYRIDYAPAASGYTFTFTDPSGAVRTETYAR